LDPLGLAGFALALVFSVVTKVVGRKRQKDTRWILGAGFALAAICAVGGVTIAYRRERPDASKAALPSMKIGTIHQRAPGGAAVAGVQGNVNVNVPASPKEVKPKQ